MWPRQDTPEDMTQLLFDGKIIGEALKNCGKDISQLFLPYKKQLLTSLGRYPCKWKYISENYSLYLICAIFLYYY